MRQPLFASLGEQIRSARRDRKLTQPALAMRLGRDRARISELERDLLNNRMGRDRLTLLAEICDALDLVPLLVPRDQAMAVRARFTRVEPVPGGSPRTTFDNVFIDLSHEDDAG